jgi:hypothetical protein
VLTEAQTVGVGGAVVASEARCVDPTACACERIGCVCDTVCVCAPHCSVYYLAEHHIL